MAEVIDVKPNKNNLDITFKSDLLSELKVDQSISHNGVCLTVADISNETYLVNVVKETIDKSNFGSIRVGDMVNVERSMMLNDRLDGHIVQGHVDQVGVCEKISEESGSWYFTFKYEKSDNITIEKGSIAINGIRICW